MRLLFLVVVGCWFLYAMIRWARLPMGVCGVCGGSCEFTCETPRFLRPSRDVVHKMLARDEVD